LRFEDQALDTVPFKDIILQVEYYVGKFKPTIVYCPFIGDLNRDHRIVAEAVMVACRPYKENAPKVFMYEINGTTDIGLMPFVPTTSSQINAIAKTDLLAKWYPDELVNGRQTVKFVERFQQWSK
jgi:LmbE family N-acetylglucosaminyl deacetylase